MAETESSWASCRESTPRDQRNSVRILGASLAWGGSLIGAALLLTQDLPGPIAWLVAPRLDWLFLRRITAGRICRSAKLFSNATSA